MKKLALTIALLVFTLCVTNAQVKGKSIGIRGGMGGELSFQTAMGSANRLEIDLGRTNLNSASNYSGTQLTGIYQWVWTLDELGPGFNWYAGCGGTLGMYSNNSNSEFGLGIVGQLGLEYNFNVPLQVAFDWRPNFYLDSKHEGYGNSALSLRYRF